MPATMKSLESRLVRVERSNRFLAVACLLLGAVLLAGATGGDEIVRGNRFELIDSSGRVRAELSADDGAVGLYIFDENGITRIGIAQFAHGGGGVALHGPDSKGAAVLYLEGEGSLRFFDTQGNVTNQVTAAPQAGTP